MASTVGVAGSLITILISRRYADDDGTYRPRTWHWTVCGTSWRIIDRDWFSWNVLNYDGGRFTHLCTCVCRHGCCLQIRFLSVGGEQIFCLCCRSKCSLSTVLAYCDSCSCIRCLWTTWKLWTAQRTLRSVSRTRPCGARSVIHVQVVSLCSFFLFRFKYLFLPYSLSFFSCAFGPSTNFFVLSSVKFWRTQIVVCVAFEALCFVFHPSVLNKSWRVSRVV